MGKAFATIPVAVPPVETPFRRIVTPIPAPGSLATLATLQRYEPLSMTGQPPIVWDRAEDCQVYDAFGNMWLDWSSGVLVANAGHSAPELKQAILQQVEKDLLYNYCFPSAERAALIEYLVELAPPGLEKVFLLTTGSETVENAIKLARTHGQKVGGKRKIAIVSFERAFHGRTLGAQMAAGWPGQKAWIGNLDPAFVQAPYPDGFRTTNSSFAGFLQALAGAGLEPADVAGVIIEAYQGGGASFAPKPYVQALAGWCREHDVLLIFDEVQAGFGRTGRLFGFQHYDVVPDLICCGKGITSSLPLSAVIGRADILDLYGPAEMTSTHTGNPVAAAVALASLRKIIEGGLIDNCQAMEPVLFDGLGKIAEEHADVVGALHGRGLVAGSHMVRPNSLEPDGDLAFSIVEKSFQKGLLMFAPVGYGGATVKIAPPLTITEPALLDGLAALAEAFREARETL